MYQITCLCFQQDAGLVKREDLPKDCFIVYQGMYCIFWTA